MSEEKDALLQKATELKNSICRISQKEWELHTQHDQYSENKAALARAGYASETDASFDDRSRKRERDWELRKHIHLFIYMTIAISIITIAVVYFYHWWGVIPLAVLIYFLVIIVNLKIEVSVMRWSDETLLSFSTRYAMQGGKLLPTFCVYEVQTRNLDEALVTRIREELEKVDN